jgi:hypothetical protein
VTKHRVSPNRPCLPGGEWCPSRQATGGGRNVRHLGLSGPRKEASCATRGADRSQPSLVSGYTPADGFLSTAPSTRTEAGRDAGVSRQPPRQFCATTSLGSMRSRPHHQPCNRSPASMHAGQADTCPDLPAATAVHSHPNGQDRVHHIRSRQTSSRHRDRRRFVLGWLAVPDRLRGRGDFARVSRQAAYRLARAGDLEAVPSWPLAAHPGARARAPGACGSREA